MGEASPEIGVENRTGASITVPSGLIQCRQARCEPACEYSQILDMGFGDRLALPISAWGLRVSLSERIGEVDAGPIGGVLGAGCRSVENCLRTGFMVINTIRSTCVSFGMQAFVQMAALCV